MNLRKNKPADTLRVHGPQSVALRTRTVIGSMATIPDRKHCLHTVLSSILPQIDRLHLYLNNYDDNFDLFQEYPALKTFRDKIHCTRSQKIGDRREHARFNDVLNYGKEYYFACIDDDIIYPPDYIKRLSEKSKAYQDKIALCVHGYSLWNNLQDFTSDRCRKSRYFHFEDELDMDALADIPGTGTLFCPAEFLNNDFHDPPFGFNDLIIGNFFFRTKNTCCCHQPSKIMAERHQECFQPLQ